MGNIFRKTRKHRDFNELAQEKGVFIEKKSDFQEPKSDFEEPGQ